MMYRTKKELRQYIRNKKREYSEQELEVLSLPIINKVLAHPKVKEASTLLLYYSLPDEVYTHDLIDQLVAMDKTVLLPKVISDTEMTLHQYTSSKDLSLGAYNIMEPNTPVFSGCKLPTSGYTASRSLQEGLRVSIVPGMAFDKEGHRLGRGKGYYDRMFSSLSTEHLAHCYKIGVCFPFQIVEAVPHDIHDIIMDEIMY